MTEANAYSIGLANLILSSWKKGLIMVNKSILLIEHEVSLGEVLRICLSEFGGWHVTLTTSIQTAIDLCAVTHPDAILLDASPSETDALIFVEQLKQHSVTQAIPILLISSRANWFTADQLQQMGFCGAISKPFNPANLAAQVSRLLGWSHED